VIGNVTVVQCFLRLKAETDAMRAVGVRASSGLPIAVGSVAIPAGASWIASFGALLLAVLGYLVAIRD
jgi:hypothetical protein